MERLSEQVLGGNGPLDRLKYGRSFEVSWVIQIQLESSNLRYFFNIKSGRVTFLEKYFFYNFAESLHSQSTWLKQNPVFRFHLVQCLPFEDFF